MMFVRASLPFSFLKRHFLVLQVKTALLLHNRSILVLLWISHASRMTILNYSGRGAGPGPGRGGRGRGRGGRYHHHHPYHAPGRGGRGGRFPGSWSAPSVIPIQNTKWIRPKEDDVAVAAEKDSQTQGEESSSSSPPTQAESSSQPVANITESQPQKHAMRKRGRNKLVAVDSQILKEPSSSPIQSERLASTNQESQQQQQHVMRKRGRNQLVAVASSQVSSSKDECSSGYGYQQGRTESVDHETEKSPKENDLSDMRAKMMKKFGKNKLVGVTISETQKEDRRQAGTEEVVSGKSPTAAVASSKPSNLEGKAKDGTLRKVGSNKLVMPGKKNTNTTQSHTEPHYEYPIPQKRHLKRPHPGDNRRQPAIYGAKRIMVAVQKPSTSTNNDDSADLLPAQEDGGGDEEQESSEQEASEKLTDFAYRETRKVKQHGSKNKKWANGAVITSQQPAGGPRSMGLVRVKQDESKTPVCTTFWRGLTCTDKYCSKRHDVPKEFAMPICSFFQRHGQCLKEDCTFRHVKVNPRATICPSFALLGFCEDPDCLMKHMREPSKRPAGKPATKGAV
jgi:hypothetical protein